MERANDGVPMGEELYRGLKIGKYEILTQLSSGGMSELFLGFTAGPGGFRKYVVVKRILPGSEDNDQFVKMFLDEARITAALNHPNIGQVFDLGEDGAGLYLAMEFIAGQNLNQITAACARRRVVLPIGLSAAVVHDLGLALHYAHSFKDPAGKAFPVVHRDVAQKNVMVTYDGVVKLLDFGIAKARGSLGSTTVGMVKGTTGYMSPEQVRGESLDGRSDVFSLGVVLWEMTTGRRLFSGETELDEMKQILSAPIPRPADLVAFIPESLSDITLRALSRDRAARFSTARDLARAMQRSCSKLLFDQEERATFMTEMFEEKVIATQLLLESAGGEMEKEDAGVGLSEANTKLVVAKGRKRIAAAAKRRVSPSGEFEEKAAEHAVAKARHNGPELPEETKTNPSESAGSTALETRGNLSLLVVAALTVLGGLAIHHFIWVHEPMDDAADYEAAVPLPGLLEPIPIPSLGSGGAPAEHLETKAVPLEPVPKVSAQVGTGTVTLAIFPEASVSRGKKNLGKTPLFNLSLPAGTYLLTVMGDDQVKRGLSVRVEAGKNTQFKLDLTDIPPWK